jgi:alcohol dehydrogenase class IV
VQKFDFITSGRIVFGRGRISEAGEAAAKLCSRILVVCGGTSMERAGVLIRLEDSLRANGLAYTYYKGVTDEPEPDIVEEGTDIARDFGCDGVLAVGGGSVIDTGKAISALLTNGGRLVDYLEGVGKGARLVRDPAPFIAIPTTAGTGSEVTKNAVITSRTARFKKSLRHEKLIPDIALVDPELTLTLPPTQTAYSGMDAITQLIEAYTTRKSNGMTDALCLYGIELAGKAMRAAFDDGDNIEAREAMSLASLLSGICLANAGLGAAHGVAAALGCFYGIPHGLACSILLPHVMELNLDVALEKYAMVGRALTGNTAKDPWEAAQSGIDYIRGLNRHMGIPKDLKPYGINIADLPDLVKASRGNSMSGNPLVLTDSQIHGFISGII